MRMLDMMSQMRANDTGITGEIQQAVGVLESLSEDGQKARVCLFGQSYELPITPGVYGIGGQVAVQESGGRPVRVLGVVTSSAEGMPVDRVVAHPGLTHAIPASWGTPISQPFGYARDTARLLIPDRTWTTAPVQGEVKTTGGMELEAEAFLIPYEGFYRIEARAKLSANMKGRRGIGIRFDDGTPMLTRFETRAPGINVVEISAIRPLVKGVSVSLALFHDAGAQLISNEREFSVIFITA